jgi:Tfp pilus assembly protein PilF
MLRAIIWLVCVYLALTVFAGCAEQRGLDGSDRAAKKNFYSDSPTIGVNSYYTSGQLLERQGDVQGALLRYQQAIEADPKFLPAHNRLGIVYSRVGQYEQAEKALKQALKLAPSDAHLHNNLAFVYLLERRYNDAEAELRNTLTINPNFKRAKMNLGIAMAKQSRYDQALTYFLDACQPHEAYYNIAMLYQAAGKVDEAKSYYKRSLTVKPDFQPAEDALHLLDPAGKSATMSMTQSQQ